jgi:thiosulfate/3-mercaptopyruvate sulfurtransferase
VGGAGVVVVSFGYDRVAVLDGGLTKWRLEDRPLDIGHPAEPAPNTIFEFPANPRPELWVDKAYVEGVVRGDIDATLICASPAREFSGEGVTRVRAGHIPGSLSVPAASLVDNQTNALFPNFALHQALRPALPDLAPSSTAERPIVVYCGGGIAAAAAALALTVLGEKHVAIYDESLNEWAADPAAELVVSA